MSGSFRDDLSVYLVIFIGIVTHAFIPCLLLAVALFVLFGLDATSAFWVTYPCVIICLLVANFIPKKRD